MTGNCILLAVNLVLAAGGALYRRIHPLDPVAAEKLREKHQAERAYSRAHLGKTAARAAVPVGVLLAILYIFGSGAAPDGRRRWTRCILRRFCRKRGTKRRTYP